jgi:AcrR family transcriptional regulator
MTDIDRRQQILEGALRVFSKHGFHKASIKMIAREAGIKSSALIYHYFEDKKALLEAIVRENTPLGKLPLIDEKIRSEMMDIPPEVALPQLMKMILSTQQNPEVIGLIRIFMSEAVRMPEVAEAAYDMQQLNLDLLAAYLKRQIELGRLRPHNPEVSARVLISTLLINFLATHVFTKLAAGFGDPDAYVDQVVAIFLNGLRSEG